MIMVKLFCHMVWTIAFGKVITQKPWVKSVPVTLKLSVFSGALIWKFEIVEFDIVSMR
jgi:hypothetical protein